MSNAQIKNGSWTPFLLTLPTNGVSMKSADKPARKGQGDISVDMMGAGR
ncbi:hypothetical protein KL86CLO1_10334 [uncultured Eubacteriales bacterium]|uniref:Uncharacterized protein n=1 Tax=uncultured Eubacteriales bacterium TaxID=172733 RepID=A0A212J0Y5_9FIRM|nr:hypothetical protein KL86CLO1_10334 [uncultured Eubacteriales bacterium]